MIVQINGEDVLVSDISKKQLDDTTVWTIDDLECSRDEMIEYFKEHYTKVVEDEETYRKGKEFIKKFYDFEEQDFKEHPTMYRLLDEENCCTDFGKGVIPFMLEEMFHNGDVDDFLPMNVSVEEI